MDIEETKYFKTMLLRCRGLRESALRTLNDTSVKETGRYSIFKTYAEEYTDIVCSLRSHLDLANINLRVYDVANMKGWADTVWPQQKSVIESIVVYLNTVISLLESELDFIEDEYTNLESFIKTRLRACIYTSPSNEKDVQNALETLFVGKGWNKGIDYDRESGKFEFSGKEYIPDFIVEKLKLCIEVKLIKDSGRKSRVIEEINADITAYRKQYQRQMFVVYDLGFIRDEIEFKRDIENAGGEIRVVIVKQ